MRQSRHCATANGGIVALDEEGKRKLHTLCPGQCVSDLKIVDCGCPCHEGREELPVGNPPERLPAAVAVSVGEPPPSPVNRQAPDGRCEHCGAPCGKRSRFAPGHDAKLKSELWKGARGGSYKDWAEIVLRGWIPKDGFNPTYPNIEITERGKAFAEEHGYTLVERRNRVRKGDPVSS